ncbi:MAG: hypothetical protein HY925_05050 [Elusimicrobia bacterium]|nr:hypothetical protein [Elusimicrobiota bacterium]
MRYFVYQDAQIMGPFTREDLGQVHGLHGDSLVCPEGAMGNKDGEWLSAREVNDLSGLFTGGPGIKASPVLEMTASGPPDFYTRLGEETRSILDGFGYSGEWTSGAFEDPDFFRQWGALVDGASTRSEELELARLRAQELEANLDQMGDKLAKYERQQNEILERLNVKDRALEEKQKALERMEDRLPQLERALEAAREELFQARERLSELRAGGVPADWKEAPPPPARRARPAPAPEPEEEELPPPPKRARRPVPEPEPEVEPEPELPAPPPERGRPVQASAPIVVDTPRPTPPLEPVREPTRSELLLEQPAAQAAPVAVPAPAPAPVPVRPKFELPPAIRLQHSTLRATAVGFTPPAPKAAMPPAIRIEPEPAVMPPAVPDEPAPIEAVAPMPEASPAAVVEPPLTAPSIAPAPAIEPLPDGILVTGWTDLAAAAPPAPAPAAGPNPFESLMPPGATGAETPAAAPAPSPFAAAEAPFPVSAVPEPEPVVFSPEPAQPPETLVQRRAPGELPPSPWGLGPSEAPAAGLPPIPTPAPEPAPAGQGLVDLTLTPAAAAPSIGEDTGTPAPRLEPVGALQRPHTMVRSIPAPATGPAADPSPFPNLSTPAPVAAPASPNIPTRPPAPAIEPPPAGAETMQRRRQSKKFLIGLGVAFTGLMATGVFFLRDPKAVVQLFTMSPNKKRNAGVDPDEVAGPAPTSLGQVKPVGAGTSPFPSKAPAPNPEPVAPPPQEPARGRDYVADNMVAAIDFAKQQPAAKGKKLGAWLTTTLVKPGDEEEWSAGAVESNVYLVSYRYFKGGRAAKQEPVTYLFEVDLDKKTIKSRNPLAKELLAGVAKAPIPGKAAKKVKKSRPAASEAPAKAAAEEEGAPPPLDDLIGPPSQEPATPGTELSGE